MATSRTGRTGARNQFEVTLIDGLMMISHVELARFIYWAEIHDHWSVEVVPLERFDAAIAALTQVIKRNLLQMAADLVIQRQCRIIRTSFDATLDARAFTLLTQKYQWCPNAIETIDYYLGVHGLEHAEMDGVESVCFDLQGRLIRADAKAAVSA